MSEQPALFEVQRNKTRLELVKEQHGIETYHTPGMDDPWMAILPSHSDKGKDIMTIFADYCRLYDEAGHVGYGNTEDGAIVALAHQLKLPLWRGA